MKKAILFTFLFLLGSLSMVQAQFGIGMTLGGDIYQRYANPYTEADSGAFRSAGNVLLNGNIGPKIWIGGRRFSLSLETNFNWGLTSFGIREYKGMGSVAFPFMAMLNFNKLSGFGKNDVGSGFAIGGGIQYSRTEWYGTTRKYEYLDRNLFRTFVAEVQFGGGVGGVCTYFYVRYGIGLDEEMEWNKANSLNVGIATGVNITQNRKNRKSNKHTTEDVDEKVKM